MDREIAVLSVCAVDGYTWRTVAFLLAFIAVQEAVTAVFFSEVFGGEEG